jgi:AraC-like DNA-binding protein
MGCAAVSVLSAILRELRFEAAGYFRLELRAPWAFSFDQRGLRGIHIVVEGRCEAAFKGIPAVALEAGDFIVAPRADPHVLRSVGGGRVPVVSSATLPQLARDGRVRAGGKGEATVILCGAFVFHEADHPALAALPRVIHVRGQAGRAPKWLAAYIDLLEAEAGERGPGSEVVMARLSDALVARALRAHASQADEPGWLKGLQDPQVAKALGVMHEDMRHPWTLASLSKTAGLSRASFAARFAENVGETPMRYLLRCRMRHAMTLLRDDRANLAQIAQRVGYGSEAALSTAFKRHTGVAPGAYRKRKAV